MSIEAIVGCQWGDEGKGKIVDRLAQHVDWVARFQGGANAGHTVFVDGRRVVLHLVPTGILHPRVRCAIGNGVVLDPIALVAELRELEALGFAWQDRLRVSPGAHLVTALHRAIETLTAQDRAIGTTGRGIGPTYAEKATRRGLRVEDLREPELFRERLRALWDALRKQSATSGDEFASAVGAGFEETAESLLATAEVIAPLVCDVSDLLLGEDDRGARILCEGAQGAWLDVDHGTYPFVTSSNTTVGSVCTGLGLPPQRIRKVIGVVKAYTTRVGLGPFPTEFTGEAAERFRERAGEYGATTHRPRRVGWYDAVLARRSCRMNGVDELVITKLDVLGGFDVLRVAVSYREAGATGNWLSTRVLEQAEPIYADLPAWNEKLSGIRRWDELPAVTRRYVDFLAAETGVRVGMVSIGPGRREVIAPGT